MKLKLTFTSATVIRRSPSRIKLWRNDEKQTIGQKTPSFEFWFRITKIAQFDSSNELKWPSQTEPIIHADNQNLSQCRIGARVPTFACMIVNGVSRKSQMLDQKPEEKAVSLRESEGAV